MEKIRKRVTVLTPRMLEIMSCLALGKTRLEVAAELNLSPGTVKNYLHHTFTRLGAVSLLDAIIKARKIYPDWMCKPTQEIGEACNTPENVRMRFEDGQLLVTFEMSVRLPMSAGGEEPTRQEGRSMHAENG